MSLIATIGIINTMVMSVYEKKVEIGLYQALGMRALHIQCLFVLEGAIIGFIGAVLGVLIGVLITSYFVIYGIDFTAMMGDDVVNVVGR